MIRYIALLIWLFSFQVIYGQNAKVDSLKSKIALTSEKTKVANLYIELARAYKEISVDSALVSFQRSTLYFDTSTVSLIRTDYHYYLAELYFEIGQHHKVLGHLDKAQEGLPNSGTITIQDIKVRNSQVYLRTGKYEQASELLLSVLPQLEQSENKSTLASCYNSLGTVMQYSRRMDKALEYYQKAYLTNLEIGELHNAYGGLANIATIHSRNNDYELSKPLYRQIIDYCQGRNETHLEALATGNLGMNYRDLNMQDSAEYYISAALELQKSLNNKRGISQMSSMLSGVYLAQGKAQKSIDLILPQYFIAEEQKNLRLQDRIAQTLGKAYKSKGNIADALFYIEKHTELQDSLTKKEVTEAVNDAQTKYESEKKEAEIERLALEDQLNSERIAKQQLALGGSVFGLGLLSFLLFRMNNQKKKIEAQSSTITNSLREKETLLREIHHRVKNNLQVISSLLGLQSRSLEDQVAIDVLTQSRARVQSMSLIHQNLYQENNLTGIHIKEYFEKLSISLMNTYRISEDIKIVAQVEDILLDVDTTIPIGLILNELITNSLKYAFVKIGGTITVDIRHENDSLILIVSDDGSGIDRPDEVLKGEGYGYELITSLVDKLEGTIDIQSTNGTKVKIEISNYRILES